MPRRSERSVLRRQLSCLRSEAITESLQPLSAVLLWESMLDEPDNVISSGFYHNVLTDGVEVSLRGDSLTNRQDRRCARLPSGNRLQGGVQGWTP